MHYYGTRLSENLSRREPEGYLLCLNVPVARTGTQEYLAEELGLLGAGIVPVYRPEEEVFSPETIASFEGMPVTNDHPPEGVDTSNIRALQKGHAHNVRRGTGEESDLLLADLIITDPHLIDLILEDGKREISCGYTYELCEENGQYIQRKIRGNHVAVVDAGRAGPRVSIKDEHPVQISDLGKVSAGSKGVTPHWGDHFLSPDLSSDKISATGSCQSFAHATGARDWRAAGEDRAAATIASYIATISERSTPKMKKSIVKKLIHMAKDGDPEAIEAVAELLEEVSEAEVIETAAPAAEPEAEEVAEAVEDPAVVVETPSGNVVAIDEEAFSGILERLDRIIELLSPAAQDEDPVEEIAEAVEEAIEAAAAEEEAEEEVIPPEGTTVEEIAEMVGEIIDPGASEVIEETGDECDPEPELISSGDALRVALRAVGPALAKMPKKQRQRVCADISARLMDRPGQSTADAGIYAALAAARGKGGGNPADLGKRIMAKRSANRKH